MRAASASFAMSPTTASPRPPASVITEQRSSIPAQVWSMSSGRSDVFGTPERCRSVTATATPILESASALAAPMPFFLPQPVISATRWSAIRSTCLSALDETPQDPHGSDEYLLLLGRQVGLDDGRQPPVPTGTI